MFRLQPIDKQLPIIISLLFFLLSIIIVRLGYLQLYCSSYYTAQGQRNFLRTEVIRPERGTIYDCKGTVIASNRPVHCIFWNGTGNRSLSPEQTECFSTLQTIVGQEEFPSLESIIHVEKKHLTLLLHRDLSFNELSSIVELYPSHPNILITTQFERIYPYGSYASHIIGYLSRHIDEGSHGKMGLEKICEKQLKGTEGTLIKTINSRGRHINQTVQELCHTGADIRTTLDFQLQSIAEQIYPQDYCGCMVIMDPINGDLKAIVSRPSFDPSLFLKPISSTTWAEIQQNKPFLNRALNPYPPGSIFKLITLSAALEHNLLQEEHVWDCEGFVQFAGRNYWCHRRHGHGQLTTVQALAQSCNVLFFELGKSIDIDLLADYAYRFGLGQKTDFLFPEGIGIVPSRIWKRTVKGECWWPGETLSVTIGQSFMLATPLQIARMISAIFTGYLVKPRILADEKVEMLPLALKQETIDFLRKSMRFVVTSGTGKQVDAIKDMEIYAKTSTAQITDFSKRKLSKDYLEHAWFVSYFRYKDQSPLVFLILAENAGTSQVASHIAKQFLIAYKRYARSNPYRSIDISNTLEM